ncbi:hypothetical protein GDO86_012163 [Hymenochirus boettgeri]|uniref:Uncharacterized protein n=1 Tax=Hymenochirus boettgeri TaxID=247094 RepID=A0A8T2IP00_9PIPI|nr:hypothetical protein GDO86_012163 [Hymenochirus boettgeri]
MLFLHRPKSRPGKKFNVDPTRQLLGEKPVLRDLFTGEACGRRLKGPISIFIISNSFLSSFLFPLFFLKPLKQFGTFSPG